MLDWDDLRYFLTIARQGSLSAAARVLRVTQPTVGRRLASFERELGTKLFVATPTGQLLSPAGRTLVAHAERMELDVLAVERVTMGRDAGPRGRVTVTASEWMIGSVLAPLVGPFASEYPDVELELLSDTRHLNLVRREADVALRLSRFEHQNVVQRKVGAVGFGLYASDAYLARHGPPDFSRQCEGHRLVAMSTSLTSIVDVDFLPRVAAKAEVAIRTNGREPMVKLAVAGIGLTCLPRLLGDRERALSLLRTPIASPERPLWIGVHRDTRALPRVKATLAFLTAAIARHRGALAPR